MAAAIEVSEVRKRYGEAIALEVDRLTVEPRASLALIGPSGCGKSTLLKVVIGLLRPERGTVQIGGVTMEPRTRGSLLLRIGYVIQEGALFPHLTAGENVALVARDQGWPKDRIDSRLRELAELTRTPELLLDRYPVQLSGGQRQRAALMRALMLDPEVLLMDEPLAALDPIIRSQLQRELRTLFETLQKTVLLVTHDMAEAAFLAEEIALMRAGRIVQRGTYRVLVERPAEPFVTEFVQAQRGLRTADEVTR